MVLILEPFTWMSLRQSGQGEGVRGGLELTLNIGEQLTAPQEVTPTNLAPDPLLWSEARRVVYFVEQTVSWEDAVGMVHARTLLCICRGRRLKLPTGGWQ